MGSHGADRGHSGGHSGGPDDTGRRLSVDYNLEKTPLAESHPPGRFEWTSFFRLQIGAGDIRRRSAALFLLLLILVVGILAYILFSGGLGVFSRYTESIQ